MAGKSRGANSGEVAVKLFLIIVGAVVTGFAICLLVLAIWLRRLARKFFGGVEDQLDDLVDELNYSIPPPRIKLVKLDAIQWQQAEEVQAIEDALRRSGFDEIGGFRVEPTKRLLQAFSKPAEAAYAIVYESPKSGVWLDLVTRYLDGEKVAYSTLRDTLLDRAENDVIRFHEGLTAEELLGRFLADRPAKPMRPVSADEFVGFFEQAHAESMDWRMARGGISEAELRRQYESRGEECSPAVVMAVLRIWAAAIDDFYQRQCREQFLSDSREAQRWGQIGDRLIVIHDRTAFDRLEELCDETFHEFFDEEGGPGSDSAAEGSGSRRSAFARWNAAQTNGRKYEKVGEVSQPVVADVYLPAGYP